MKCSFFYIFVLLICLFFLSLSLSSLSSLVPLFWLYVVLEEWVTFSLLTTNFVVAMCLFFRAHSSFSTICLPNGTDRKTEEENENLNIPRRRETKAIRGHWEQVQPQKHRKTFCLNNFLFVGCNAKSVHTDKKVYIYSHYDPKK